MNDEHTSLSFLRNSLNELTAALDKLNAALQPWHQQIEKIERVALSELPATRRLEYANLIVYGKKPRH
jgi:prefoldin subunit 5